ncbi:MAG: MMPL family transporter [Clostridia bacterium]|nr:MMPL family transporter [Clostridia bacterium]
MKRVAKPVFFIIAAIILALVFTAFFGVYSHYGDRDDTLIKGAGDIRFGIDIRGGVEATFGPTDPDIAVSENDMNGLKDIIARRLILSGVTDYELYTDTANKQVIVRYPWASHETEFDATAAIEELGRTAQLEFHIGSETKTEKDDEGNEITVPSGKLVLTGNDVASAEAIMYQDEKTGETVYAVQLTLEESGKKAFSDATKQQKGSGTISIWLDDEMISNPTVNDHITDGVATISGSYETYADAVADANLITSGALPFTVEVKSSGSISPTMGEKALESMVLAGIIAFIIIAIYMVIRYRLPGTVAVLALAGQIAGAIACISGYFGSMQGFTLTIPGLAGIILTMGMGVDANTITAERIREEIRAGRTIDGAVDRGSKASFSAIFDGNITVAIVSVVLMGVFGSSTSFWAKVFGWLLAWFPVSTTGSVYSFGFTLLVGIIWNFIMGVWFSRLMLKSLCRFKGLRKVWLLGGERA